MLSLMWGRLGMLWYGLGSHQLISLLYTARRGWRVVLFVCLYLNQHSLSLCQLSSFEILICKEISAGGWEVAD